MTADGIAEDPQLAGWQREAHRALARQDYQDAHAFCMRILERSPSHAEPYFVLALIAAAHGNFSKALSVIDRAIALNPKNAAYHAHRGRFLIALRRFAQAFDDALRAVAFAPADALTWDTVGVVFTRAGAHERAVEPYKRAVELDPNKSSYWYNLAASLQFIGEFSEAEAAYRRAIALEPGQYRAWSALAEVGRFTAAEVQTLEQFLAADVDEVDAELHLCHALAKWCEREGQADRSFELLERGKRRKRAELNYSFEADRALFEAAKHSAAGAQSACPSSEPIFIVGMPRTGTTLLERILSSHPGVFAAGELSQFSIAVKQHVQTRSAHVLDAETLRAATHMDLQGVGEQYISSTRPRTGHTGHFIDKMPLNFFYAGLIRRALPRARIICLHRHPLDTCLSNFRQLFATTFSYYNYSYDLVDTARYFVEFDRLSRHWRESLGEGYMEVRYEDVVDDPESAARRLLSFCDLSWDPACLQFHRNAAPVATASSVQVRQPIYKSSVERWRRYERQLEPARAVLESAGISL